MTEITNKTKEEKTVKQATNPGRNIHIEKPVLP